MVWTRERDEVRDERGEEARARWTDIDAGQVKCGEEETEKSQEAPRGGGGAAGGWLNPGLFARSKWRSAVILKFSPGGRGCGSD